MASAELKVGTAVEKYEIMGVDTRFTVPPETKIYAGAKVSGVENDNVYIVFFKGGVEASRVELKVPRTPYRTHAYKTMHKGDSGDWTARVLGPGGAVLASTDFRVDVPG